MQFILRRLIHTILFNITIFLILIIGIQNSSQKSKVNFLINESVELPISFIIGISFITGSLFGNITDLKYEKR